MEPRRQPHSTVQDPRLFRTWQINSRQNRVFTLIELIVVIIIVANLAAVAVPNFHDRADDSRQAATLQSLLTLRGAVELYPADNGSYTVILNTDLYDYLKSTFQSTSVGGAESAVVEL